VPTLAPVRAVGPYLPVTWFERPSGERVFELRAVLV
jgi:hypothetical protein